MKKILLVAILAAVSVHAFALDAQKIVELKGGSESLPQFLSRLPTSFEAQVFYGLLISGLVGLIASWLNKWRTGEADGFHHFTPRYVAGQVIWLVGAAVGAIATLGFQTDTGEFWGWMSVIVNGAFMGFAGEMKTKPQA